MIKDEGVDRIREIMIDIKAESWSLGFNTALYDHGDKAIYHVEDTRVKIQNSRVIKEGLLKELTKELIKIDKRLRGSNDA